jgi:hypothetical protein
MTACSQRPNEPPGDRSAERLVVHGTDEQPGLRAAERIAPRVVALDPTMRPQFPRYASDGSQIVFSAASSVSTRTELFSVHEDGSALRCLSCGVAPDVAVSLLKPFPFPDHRRLLVRIGEQMPDQPARHAVLECDPGLIGCSALVPIATPPAGDAVVLEDQREFRIAPDGVHVGFSQVRQTPGGDAMLIAVVGTLRRAATSYEVDDPRVIDARGELKGFTPDGSAALVAIAMVGPYEAANPDVVQVDLCAGGVTRVTYALDYDEPLELAPHGDSYVVGSGRGAGLFETVSQLRRPNFIAPGIRPLTAFLFQNEREAIIEPWLVANGSESAGALGQRLNPDSAAEGYEGRAIANWSPAGDRIVHWEGLLGDDSEDGNTRIVVIELLDRSPRPPGGAVLSPDPSWAAPLTGFVPPDVSIAPSRAGRVSGSTEITRRAVASGFELEVEYHDFSDDGDWTINGFERARYPGGTARASSYRADLTASGHHVGWLHADAVITPVQITGAIDSEVDGRALHLPR